MRATNFLCLVLSLLASTAGGCDEGDSRAAEARDAGGAGEDAGRDAARTDAPGGLALETVCDQIEASASGLECPPSLDPQQCEAATRRTIEECRGLLRAVDQGRVTYDPVAAEACGQRDGFSTASPAEQLFGCPEAFAGKVEEGAPCYNGYAFQVSECAPNLYCDAFLTCPSTCKAYVEEGEFCGGLHCVQGLSCAQIADSWQCIRPRPDGDACESFRECESVMCAAGECVTPQRECDGPSTCGDGMTCVEDEIGSSACTLAAAEAEPCAPAPCARDHYCRDEGGDQGVCRPDGELGDACDAPVDVGDYNTSCASGLHCMVSSTGTCLPPGALSEPCDTRNGDSCQEGLACAVSMGSTCQPLGALGDPCNPAFIVACAEGRCACGDDATGDASCEEGTCVALLELGEPCTDNTLCASRFCNTFVSDPVCDVTPTLRDACVPPE